MFKIVFRAKGTSHWYNSGEFSDLQSDLVSILERLEYCNSTYEYAIEKFE